MHAPTATMAVAGNTPAPCTKTKRNHVSTSASSTETGRASPYSVSRLPAHCPKGVSAGGARVAGCRREVDTVTVACTSCSTLATASMVRVTMPTPATDTAVVEASVARAGSVRHSTVQRPDLVPAPASTPGIAPATAASCPEAALLM